MAFIIDASGSMSGQHVKVANELQAAMDDGAISEVVLLYCDTEVYHVDRFANDDRIELAPIRLGGTDMRPAFKAIEDDDPDASLIVCLTDLSIGDPGPEPAQPTLWMAYGLDPRIVKIGRPPLPTWGRVIDIDEPKSEQRSTASRTVPCHGVHTNTDRLARAFLLKWSPTMHGNQIASPLSRKATLCALNISTWSARKLDRKITDEVNRSHNAKADAGRYNKLLVKKERLEAITSTVSALRALHYQYTKPWSNDGQRILPNTIYMEFTGKARVLIEQFDRHADHFAQNFRVFVEERKAELNGMFKPEDYPSEREIRSKFKVELLWDILPDAGDFRADVLDKDTIEDIRAEIASSIENAERAAMTDTYKQVADVVGHMAEKLGKYGIRHVEGLGKRSYFMDSLVGNVRDLVKLLPAFNLTGDGKLSELAARMEKELCTEEAQTLRDNNVVRETVKKSAEEILAEVERVMA